VAREVREAELLDELSRLDLHSRDGPLSRLDVAVRVI
jgi:hypothetical protein